MTVRLTVQRERWWAHVTDVAENAPGLVPVVKGNGYGFGRATLATMAARLGPLMAVGTVHEVDAVPAGATAIVLTPTLRPPTSPDVVLTVGSQRHIDALGSWGGRVIVKLESSMHRFGGGIELVERAQWAGLRTVGVAIHPPLSGGEEQHLADVLRWLPEIDPSLDVWVSHLSPSTFESLPESHRYKIRIGTYLWHGDRAALKLEADVLDVRPVKAGVVVGYRQQPVDGEGTILVVGAGSANGVAVNVVDDPDHGVRQLSPFHFAERPVALIEPPHMHVSMLFLPGGYRCPRVGDWVDVQRPLTTTTVDELRWI